MASAEKTDFSYNSKGTAPHSYGSGKAETVNVAAKLYWPGLIGKKIVSLSVPVEGNVASVTDCSGFITTELKTRNQGGTKVNDPDVCSVAGTLQGNILTVNFPEPYTIPAEGVYVGYALTVTDSEATPAPAAVVESSTDNAFWFRGSKSQLRWRDEGHDSKLASALSVTLEGDFATDAAMPAFHGPIYTAGDTPYTLDVEVVSQGLNPLRSIDYTYEAAGTKRSGSYTFPEQAEGFGMSATLPLDIEPLGEPTATELKLTINRVNGVPNGIADAYCKASLEVLPFLPHNRPLVEEYTGLRCGYCPRGWIILRQMAEDYTKEEFVALSYHSGRYESGAMVYISTEEFPFSPDGYPASQVNRYGSSSVDNIPKEWASKRTLLPEGEINVELSWDKTDNTKLVAKSTTKFIHSAKGADYRVAFALVADDLSDPTWAQYNAYRNQTENTTDFESKYWNLFLGKEENIMGLTYDDVVIHFPNAKGIAGSLPADIEAGSEYTNEFTVDTPAVLNVLGQSVVSDFNKTRMVAMIIDGQTGNVINCASSAYPDGTPLVSQVAISSEPTVRTVYHDISGRIVATPERGIYIKTTIMKDGSHKTEKILIP